jgi:hypothetical protein
MGGFFDSGIEEGRKEDLCNCRLQWGKGLVDVWGDSLNVLPFGLERFGKPCVCGLGITVGNFSKGFDSIDPLIYFRVYPGGF